MTTNLPQAIESALISGDLSKLDIKDRLSYYNAVCSSVGLNPLTQPFAYITLNGKLTLYAKRDATDQLRKIHKVSIAIPSRELIGEVYVVTARAKDSSGRDDESTGAVCVTGLKGDSLANAYLKAETKAKRRVTLSICGLGLLDESEVDSIPGADKAQRIQAQIEQVKAPPTMPESTEVRAEEPPHDIEEPSPDHPLASYPFPSVAKRYTGKTFGDVSIQDLIGYASYMRDYLTKDGKPVSGKWAELLDNIEIYTRGS